MKLIARVDGVIGDAMAKKYWYHTDHLGSVKAVTKADGSLAWKADYLPFGQQHVKEKIDPTFEEDDLGFTGKGYDAEIGLYYFNARWYDADTGRFISEDPMGDPNNPNLYSYCRNNPLRFTDPTGLIGEDGYPGSNPINWPGGNNNQDGSYTGGSGGPTGTPSSGGFFDPIGLLGSGSPSFCDPLKGPSMPGVPGEGPISGGYSETKYKNGGYSVILRDSSGKIVSEYSIDKNGYITQTIAYHDGGSRTAASFSYTEQGTVVSIKNQTPNKILGLTVGWTTKNYSVRAYDTSGNLDFVIHKNGSYTMSNDITYGLLSEASKKYADIYNSFGESMSRINWKGIVYGVLAIQGGITAVKGAYALGEYTVVSGNIFAGLGAAALAKIGIYLIHQGAVDIMLGLRGYKGISEESPVSDIVDGTLQLGY